MAEPTVSDVQKNSWHRVAGVLRMPRRRLWVIGAVAVVLLAVVGLVTRPDGAPANARVDPRNRPLPISAAPATKGGMDVSLNGRGTATPRNVVTVRSRVDGQLVKLYFREGQVVKAG